MLYHLHQPVHFVVVGLPVALTQRFSHQVVCLVRSLLCFEDLYGARGHAGCICMLVVGDEENTKLIKLLLSSWW
jgi:hypothetical protein